MTATVVNSRVVISPPPMPKRPGGPVTMPDMRIEESVFGEVRLVAGPVERPICHGICATRAVAERTLEFFGGSRA